MIGRQLSHFEVLEELGSGGMGQVYRARDLALQRTVALKTLPVAAYEEEHRRRLLAEARAASALNHPGIVTIYEVGESDGVDFIAMELVEGESLASLQRRGPLPPQRVLPWAVELAEALAAAHRRGIVHRDLKPANVMVTEEGRLKILDFGLAKRLPPMGGSDEMVTETELAKTHTGAVMGTPAYMSPEQAAGRRVDARSDLFALGAVLYEMLTGERPFTGGSSIELLSAVLRHDPGPPSRRRPAVDPAWDAILERLLAKDPEQRYASSEALLADLRRLAPRGRRGAPRTALLAAAGMLLVLLLAA
ncbi:MAG TPA: serine/threonine-protein kinase, partial [Thermoanaerobaculia bacterium]|nr:serine/threonine-protein kinase [Thermoanaerobaculia bacterium]